MNTIIQVIILNSTPLWFSYASGFASLIALIFIVLYFINPKIKLTYESNLKDGIIRIKCKNQNIFRNPIKDIRCDIVASKCKDFEFSKTLDLQKDWIPGIMFRDFYVFKVKNFKTIKDYKFIKVRILSLNIIGVKKIKELVFPL